MIDLHCHILPDIDDGPKSIDQSLAMARGFEEAGYEQVVATPHAVPGTHWMPSPAAIRERVAELNQALQDEGIQLTILPGMEIALDPQIPDLLKDGRIQSLADTSYLLIEPPFQRLPLGWEQVFFELTSKGYTPLLAHPERCEQLTDKQELLDDLFSRGTYLQVNWGSFLGHHGRKATKTAVYLASRGYIHCLATDSHRPDKGLTDSLELAAPVVEEIVGPRNLELLARENPLRVLRGEPLIDMAVEEIRPEVKKRRKWGIF